MKQKNRFASLLNCLKEIILAFSPCIIATIPAVAKVFYLKLVSEVNFSK